ncbi:MULTISPECIES: TspO/MBR family protein [Iodidimonas]|jgi:tryptophan-rich sensory protein|uniref:Sensory protein TspO n=1 Tax=Iodidimonas nitroreducens TaxID=1236968 RepID=A0A5A7N799_9PROT|nr:MULTISPECIES: TspO/MBR family protein [Iodidimonas]GAK32665.1 translocator protein [alpha proteobacterium Q-1]GER04203.1 sensory protein TspO [Iodidimonas nitroreducens]
MREYLVLGGFLLLCFIAASSGAFFRPGDWYKALEKPRWRPPDWLFPPVWSILYLMIAFSGWLVWKQAGFAGAGALALSVYGLQLVLNGLWSAVFFGLHRIGLALIELFCLWLSVLLMIALFYPLSPLAAWLLVPYALWGSFAMALNARIWWLNRG